MKPLLSVSRDRDGETTMFYLRYASVESVAVEKTICVLGDERIALDVDASGEVIGIELISPDAEEFEVLGKLARERGLSLDGLLSIQAAAALRVRLFRGDH